MGNSLQRDGIWSFVHHEVSGVMLIQIYKGHCLTHSLTHSLPLYFMESLYVAEELTLLNCSAGEDS